MIMTDDQIRELAGMLLRRGGNPHTWAESRGASFRDPEDWDRLRDVGGVFRWCDEWLEVAVPGVLGMTRTETESAVARALEPDPQQQADAELGAALRRVLAACHTRLGLRKDFDGWWLAIVGNAAETGDTPTEALRALAARLEQSAADTERRGEEAGACLKS